MLDTAIEVSSSMAAEGVGVRVVSVPWLDPLDVDTVQRAGAEYDLVVTLEEHSICGGLGSAVAEVLAESVAAAPLVRIGLPPAFTSVVGSQTFLLEHYGLDTPAVTSKISGRWRQLRRGH